MQVEINPDAQVISYGPVAPGEYELVIREDATIRENQTKKPPVVTVKSFEFKMVLTENNGTLVDGETNEALKGLPGTVYYSAPFEPKDWQGKLRALVEAVGLEWASFRDTSDLVGRPFRAVLKLTTITEGSRAGSKKNEISKLLKA